MGSCSLYNSFYPQKHALSSTRCQNQMHELIKVICDAFAQSKVKQRENSGYNTRRVTDVLLYACTITHKWLVTVCDLVNEDQ